MNKLPSDELTASIHFSRRGVNRASLLFSVFYCIVIAAANLRCKEKNLKKKSLLRRVCLVLLALLLALGGGIAAYAPLLHKLTERVVLCVLAKMP